MAQMPGGFDSTKIKDGIIPNGEYLAQMNGSTVSETKGKTGYKALLFFTIVDGEYKGYKVSDLVNYINRNPIAQEMGQKRMKEYRKAVLGCDGPIDDTDILHNVPIRITVGFQPAKDGYPPKNIITSAQPAQGGSPAVNAAPSGAAVDTAAWNKTEKPAETTPAKHTLKETPKWGSPDA